METTLQDGLSSVHQPVLQQVCLKQKKLFLYWYASKN